MYDYAGVGECALNIDQMKEGKAAKSDQPDSTFAKSSQPGQSTSSQSDKGSDIKDTSKLGVITGLLTAPKQNAGKNDQIQPNQEKKRGRPRKGSNHEFKIESGSVIIGKQGSCFRYNFDELDPIIYIPSAKIVEKIFSSLINNLCELQSSYVYYKNIKISSFSLPKNEMPMYNSTDCKLLSEAMYKISPKCIGKISDKKPNTEKVLGFSVEFNDINAVSRRQIGFTCFETSQNARSDEYALKLTKTLTKSFYVDDFLKMKICPAYKREGMFMRASGCNIEGLRDTAAKKRRFVKSVYKSIDE